jgi:hypothetical protein
MGIELSQHSAVMGGQFPTKNDREAFKNPIFYGVAAVQTALKNELSFLMVQKPGFYTVFFQICGFAEVWNRCSKIF